jgi:ABC-type glycerol-3-phosphate transport system substrate-binding protein
MTVNGHWALPEFQSALGADAVGIARWPMLPNGERPRSLVQGMFVAVPAGLPEERAATARSLAHWITTDDAFITQITAESIHLPAVSYIPFDDYPLRTAISAALENSAGLPYIPGDGCFWSTLQTTLDRLLAEEIAPEEAAALTQLGVDDCIAAQQTG